MAYEIRMVYSYPTLTRDVVLGDGRTVQGRVPGHPTRPAREWEIGGWYEEFYPELARAVYGDGCLKGLDVREV